MRLLLLSRFCALLACVLAFGPRAPAETVDQVPNPRRSGRLWVSDAARVLDVSTKRKLNGLISGLERRTSAEVAVVTIQSADGLEPKPFATRLFNLWGVGKRGSDNGVLLLLVMDARRVEVETGDGMGQVLPDSRVQSILDERAVPRFRAGDYAGGVLASVREIIRAIESSSAPRAAAPRASGRARPKATLRRASGRPQSARPRATATQSAGARSEVEMLSGDSRSGRSSGGAGWLPFAAGALALPLAGWAVVRSGTRRCPQCHQKMQRLSEAEDDALLAFDQKFEEDLGSVDYRAWRCGSCGASTVERAVKWLSGYDDCPRCSHRTLSSQTTILRHPTYSHTGESQTVRTCRFPRCGFGDQKKRTLPRKQRTTHHSSSSGHSHSSGSSSSGSFGGGSSSGGGAGASW